MLITNRQLAFILAAILVAASKVLLVDFSKWAIKLEKALGAGWEDWQP